MHIRQLREWAIAGLIVLVLWSLILLSALIFNEELALGDIVEGTLLLLLPIAGLLYALINANHEAQKRADAMNAEVVSTKTSIAAGLERGLVFFQRSYDDLKERAWVDELIAEGKAIGFWAYEEGYSATGMVRLVRGTGDRPKVKPSPQWLNELPGTWAWDRPSKPSKLILHLCQYGLDEMYAGLVFRKLARERGLYPKPITPAFLSHAAINIAHRRKGHLRTKKKDYFYWAAQSTLDGVIRRLANPTAPVERYNPSVDHFLAWHGLAPLPPIETKHKLYP